MWPSGMMTSLTSGLPSRETWTNGPAFTFSPPSASHTRAFWRLAVVQTPMVGCPLTVTAEIGTWIAIECTFRWLVALTPAAAGQLGQPERGVQVLERPQVAQVEDRAQVDVEGLGALAGEHADPAAQAVHGRRRPGWRSPAWTAARCCTAGRPGRCRARAPGRWAGDRVGLAAVPVRAASDSIGPVLYRNVSGSAHRGGEAELVGDVGPAVAVVVDVDLVQHIVAELVEVRAARRPLQRDVVGDQGDRVRLIRADERVHVGAVGHRVLGDFRCLAVR